MQTFIIAAPQHLIPGCIQIQHDHHSVFELDILPTPQPIMLPDGVFEKKLLESFGEYFAHPEGGINLPVHLRGTEFQCRVWNALQRIKVGSVMAYGELAQRLNSSARAIGTACRRNPIPLIVPCHRVVAKAGIGGFSGATQGPQIEQKRRLLAHEGVVL